MSPLSNQTFRFPRFVRLFSRHTAEHWPGYAMAAAVVAGLLLLMMAVQTYTSGTLSIPVQAGYYIIFTSTVFGQFGEKRQATVALLLPASHLEKYLVAWLYSLPIFLLVFTGIFYLVDGTVLYVGAGPGQPPELLNVLANAQIVKSVLVLLVLLHAVWLLGAIYFEKTHFIKTGFAAFILLLVLSVVNFQALRLLVAPGLRPAPPFTKLMMLDGAHVYNVGLPDGQADWLGFVPLGLALLLWGASYFRLTEKQL
jgi:hypothetical protein